MARKYMGIRQSVFPPMRERIGWRFLLRVWLPSTLVITLFYDLLIPLIWIMTKGSTPHLSFSPSEYRANFEWFAGRITPVFLMVSALLSVTCVVVWNHRANQLQLMSVLETSPENNLEGVWPPAPRC